MRIWFSALAIGFGLLAASPATASENTLRDGARVREDAPVQLAQMRARPRPGLANRPGMGNRPGIGHRPGSGHRPPAWRPPGTRPPAWRPPGMRPPGWRPPRPAARPPLWRPWRPGLRYRIYAGAVSVTIASQLSWCHVHRYRVQGMPFHANVQCHRHRRWNHPSIRYVYTD